MRTWAFGISPHGLGLTPEALWRLSTREYRALEDVYNDALYRWAIERAWFNNAHFRAPGQAAWLPEDFLGTGDRKKRQLEADKAAIDVKMATAKLAAIRPGAPPTSEVPDWARGAYGG